MSVIQVMNNRLFNAQALYVMVRHSLIKYFPYPATDIGADQVLTIYMKNVLGVDIHIQSVEKERELIFKGASYDLYKDMEKNEEGPDHSPAWYVMQVAKWHKHNIQELNEDLNMMRSWLEANDYIKSGLPTDKFLQQEFLIISDVAAEKRKIR